MKKIVFALLAIMLVFNTAAAKVKKPKKSTTPVVPVQVLTNGIDSMSYALGMNVGADFAKNLAGIPGGKSNIDLLVNGFSAAMKGDSTLLSAELATSYFGAFIAKAQAEEVDAKKHAGEKFLSENMSAEGVFVTPTGLQYKVLVPAEGVKPQSQDTVKVHYVGTLLDGTKFDSSIDRGEPIEFPLNQVIKGWTEGVQLMSVGSKYKFYVPYNLGYGDQGAGGAIPPYSTLVFEVELLGFKTFKEPAPVIEIKELPAPKKTSKSTKKVVSKK